MKITERESTITNPNERGAAAASDLEQQIRRRAYELYERRGCAAGHESEDWLAAEAELSSERTEPVAAAAVRTNRKPPVKKAAKSKAMQGKKVESLGAK